MITIRREQLDALAAPFAARFIDRAVARVQERFPAQCAALGEAGTRDAVVLALARAEQHGFGSDEELLTYLMLMFTFGRDFDTTLEWARAALRRRGSAGERLAHLRADAMEHEDEGQGYLGPGARGAGHG